MKADFRFILADDHAIVRKGLMQLLKDEFPNAIIKESADAKSVIDLLKGERYDLLISDISMPGMTGLELIKQIKSDQPELPVLVLSMHAEEHYAIRALKVGASGYLTKESAPEELIKAVRFILNGKKYISSSLAGLLVNHLSDPDRQELHETLSDRELEVLKLIAKGMPITEIGAALHLSANTISTYRSRILEKMSMKSNADLIQYAIHHHLL